MARRSIIPANAGRNRAPDAELDPETGALLEPMAPAAQLPDTMIADDPEDLSIRRVIDGMGDASGAAVRVYRQGRDANDLEYVDEYPVQDWSPARVQANHGGGAYRIIVQDALGRRHANRLLKIAPPRPDSKPQANGAELAAVLLAGFREITTGMVSAIIAAIPKPPERDPIGELEKLSAVVKNLLPAPAPVAAPAGKPFEDVLAAIAVMDKIKSLSPVVDTKDGTSGNAVLVEAVRQLGPVFQDAMKRGQGVPSAGAPALPAPTGIQPVSAPLPATVGQPEEGAEVRTIISLFVGQLVTHAEKGRDVNAYATMVLDALEDLPEEVSDTITAKLEAETWLAELAQYDNRVTAFGDWFGRLRAAILEAYKEDASADSADATPPDAAA